LTTDRGLAPIIVEKVNTDPDISNRTTVLPGAEAVGVSGPGRTDLHLSKGDPVGRNACRTGGAEDIHKTYLEV
jgi:hypothetical protein